MIYTVEEYAALKKVSRKSVYRWIKAGLIKAEQVGRRLWRIHED